MNILKNLSLMFSIKKPQLTARLFNGNWSTKGYVKRTPDTRTVKQLLENIDYYAQSCPEVAKFKNELKLMNPKYLGLVSDICELAGYNEQLHTGINMKELSSDGKSLFQFLIEKLPQASEKNPESLELSRAIIDNTDSIAAKYALASLSPLYDCKDAAHHMKAVIPLIDDIAKSTLQGGYLMDYSKEKSFVNAIKSFITPSVILEKLQMLPEILKVTEKSKATCIIDSVPFVTNPAPMEKIVENFEVFKNLDKYMEGKTINLTEFLEKNVNIK